MRILYFRRWCLNRNNHKKGAENLFQNVATIFEKEKMVDGRAGTRKVVVLMAKFYTDLSTENPIERSKKDSLKSVNNPHKHLYQKAVRKPSVRF